MNDKNKLAVRDITVIALCAAIMLAAQLALRALPNIELVSLLIIVFTRFFGKRTIFIIYVFVLVEGLIYGFHLWWIAYLYVWLILYFVVRAVGESESAILFAVIAALFGLCFGFFCSFPYFVTAGISGGITYFLAGIGFDLLHCGGNFLLVLILYKPLCAVMKKVVS